MSPDAVGQVVRDGVPVDIYAMLDELVNGSQALGRAIPYPDILFHAGALLLLGQIRAFEPAPSAGCARKS